MTTLPYSPPGVTVQELVSQSLVPQLAVPRSLLLIGLAGGTPTATDVVTLLSTTPTVLPQLPVGATGVTWVKVMDNTTPSVTASAGFAVTTDFTFNSTNRTVTRVVTTNTLSTGVSATATSFTLSGGSVPAVGQVVRLTATGGAPTETGVVSGVSGQVVTVSAPIANDYSSGAGSLVSWGSIPDGDQISFTYSYIPSDYFDPIRLSSMADIQNRFGAAIAVSGGSTVINSHLSFAAQCAHGAGAADIILQPFYKLNNSGVPVKATAADTADPTKWVTVLNGLTGLEDLDVIVPVVGQSNSTSNNDGNQLGILEAVQDYMSIMLTQNGQYMITVAAEDSTSNLGWASESAIQSHASALVGRYSNALSQQMVLLNTSAFTCTGTLNTNFTVGGQYVAAAIGGMLMARTPSATLTRQPIPGFLAVADARTKPQKNADASNGLLVVESKGSVVQVRHGITLDLTTVATRELNVVHAKHYMINSVRETLETQVIGKLIADANATTSLNSLVIGVLEDLRGLRIIDAYDNIESRITSLDPTAMELRYAYKPIFYVNYIAVLFSIDLTAQTITVSSSSGAPS